MSAFDVGVLATLVLFAFPLLVGTAAFALLVGHEIPKLLKSERIQSALEMRLVAHNAVWSIGERKIPWPAMQLEWAALAAMLAILVPVASVAQDEMVQGVWFAAGAVNSILAFALPLCLYLFFHRPILRFVRGQLVSRLSTLSRHQSLLLRRLSMLGGRIEKMYSEVDLSTTIHVAQISKVILLERATTGSAQEIRDRLERAIKTLRRFSSQVGAHLEGYHQTVREFEFAKNLVIDRGSATLLAELDRLKEELASEDIRFFFDGAQWARLQERLDQIAFDLRMITNIAAGGSDLPVSFGQACQMLNVTSDTSLKTAKAVVDALRRVWHPDTGANDDERERRTVKIQQINAAWEIFSTACNEGDPRIAAPPARVLELA